MIKSIIYAPPIKKDITDFSETFYINSHSNFIAEKYCILRSDLVIFLASTRKDSIHIDFCEYFKIPYKIMQIQDVIKLTDQKSVALIGDTQNAKYLNKVYKILKEYKHNNLTIYTSGSKRSGTIIVEKLINKDYKK